MDTDPYVAALRALCHRVGEHKAVAREAGISADNLWQILNGTKLPSGNARGVGPSVRKALSAKYPDWMSGSAPAAADTPSSNVQSAPVVQISESEVTIPQFETGGAMGFGFTLQDQPGVIRRWVVSPDWLQQNVHRITSAKNLAIVTGFGDSMRPLYNPGDPLLIDRGIDRADIDGIYFFRVGGEGFVKRLQRIPTVDGVIIRAKSENSQYDPFDIVKGMDFQVLGRVVKAWRGEDF